MILIIDDEAREMDSYVRELKLSGYRVVFQKDVDDALEFLRQNLQDIRLVILDIMMPPGKAFKGENTRDGLRTGMFFYGRIREMAPDLPVVILTNVRDERVAKRFHKENRCWFLRKEDYLPFELVEEIGHLLG